MKRRIALCLVLVWSVCILTACGQQKNTEDALVDSTQETTLATNRYFKEEIKESPDKYTWYIKNYVGRNCATIGYFTAGGFLNESYGEGSIKIVIVAEDGSFVDSDTLKDYVVIEQSVAPNTELKYVFAKDSEGNESTWNIESQNIEEMEILVKRVGSQ